MVQIQSKRNMATNFAFCCREFLFTIRLNKLLYLTSRIVSRQRKERILILKRFPRGFVRQQQNYARVVNFSIFNSTCLMIMT